MKLTKKTKKLWFLNACYKGKPIMNKHHIVPKHHGGETSELVEVTLLEHALAHLKIYNNTGCKTCYKSYKTIMGQHNEWVRIQKLFNDKVHYDIIDYDKDVRDKKHKNKHPYKQMCFREPMDFSNSVDDVVDTGAEELIYKKSEDTLKDDITQTLDTLKEREREVLKMYYGIDYDREYTLSEISDKFYLTIDRINQIRFKGIKRLQHKSRLDKLFYHTV
jgi:RNA polymerase sigma factor (sigma-70 family)